MKHSAVLTTLVVHWNSFCKKLKWLFSFFKAFARFCNSSCKILKKLLQDFEIAFAGFNKSFCEWMGTQVVQSKLQCNHCLCQCWTGGLTFCQPNLSSSSAIQYPPCCLDTPCELHTEWTGRRFFWPSMSYAQDYPTSQAFHLLRDEFNALFRPCWNWHSWCQNGCPLGCGDSIKQKWNWRRWICPNICSHLLNLTKHIANWSAWILHSLELNDVVVQGLLDILGGFDIVCSTGFWARLPPQRRQANRNITCPNSSPNGRSGT